MPPGFSFGYELSRISFTVSFESLGSIDLYVLSCTSQYHPSLNAGYTGHALPHTIWIVPSGTSDHLFRSNVASGQLMSTKCASSLIVRIASWSSVSSTMSSRSSPSLWYCGLYPFGRRQGLQWQTITSSSSGGISITYALRQSSSCEFSFVLRVEGNLEGKDLSRFL